MKAFLLGAGASRGAFDETFPVPVSAEFGKTLASLDPCWKQNFPALLRVVEHLGLDKANWPLEPVWSCIDYYAKLPHALPLPAPWQDGSKQIKKALLLVYGQRCDTAPIGDKSTLARLLRDDLRAGDTLISFNYDTIAERAALKYGLRLLGAPYGAPGCVTFAKPHGSTSWTLDLRCPRSVTWQSKEHLPLLDSLQPCDVDCDKEPLVLGAVPIKSELIREVQERHNVHGVFDAICVQWRVVVEALRDAKTLIVVGYGFPFEDQYGRFLMKEGLHLRDGKSHGGKLKVELFEVENRVSETSQRIVSLFGDRIKSLRFRGPVKPANNSLGSTVFI